MTVARRVSRVARAPAWGSAGALGAAGAAGAREGRVLRGGARGDDGGPGLAEVLAAVAAALRSGRTPAQAWRSVGVRAVDGVPAADDLAALGDARPEHVAAVQAVCRLTGETGSPAAGVVDRLLGAVAADVVAARAREAALAGPRTTARLLAWLPVTGLVVGVTMGADPIDVALDGGWGTAAVVTGVALTWIGRRWSGSLVARAVAAGGAA